MSRPRAFDDAQRLLIVWLVLAVLGCAGTETDGSRADGAESMPDSWDPVDEKPKLIHMPPPLYPERPRARGISGVVGLDVLVGSDGGVKESRVTRSVDPELDAAAIAAMSAAVFRPATREGRPVAAWLLQVEIEFKPEQTSPVLVNPQEFDKAPELISIDPVEYPDDARERGIEGDVLVRVLVGENGRVRDGWIMRSVHPLVDAAALAAAKTAVFEPAKLHGKPVAVWMVIPMGFKLRE